MKPIYTQDAPLPIGCYSQAFQTNSNGATVYLSGQIGLDPKTMELISDDVEQQIHQAFKNLMAVCDAAGGNSSKVVKLTIYMIDFSHFALVNRIMENYFSEPMPARAAVGVKQLPKEAQFEVEGIMQL